ncbi:ABC transporter ATP-binding protein [Jatrophihabitans cynanchi]|uniref:ABC transporter ATP-binding protein n=1 Tax=Jatrophihabitans cynanchi TaxID=2944128 RepID=A0ABY7K2E2_9ACTN|nr:ABC transporter ATP-binding protein [Jatrophihabitans sp. SB3-54]WAX58992.1 ABC transporter ATP-binding protein [Jatrophihabitans sp. SB3-54]
MGGRDAPVLHGVSVCVGAGQILGIAGESGSGKTMAGLALMGLLPSGARASGRAVLDGRDLLALPAREMRRARGRDVAMVFQDPLSSLHPMLTIGHQLTDHVRHHRGLTRTEAAAHAKLLLERVHLPGTDRMLKTYPHQLSGGMRQRIAIAMALACEPKLIIADEPTTALDVTVQAGILALLDDLRRNSGVAIVVITHDLGVLSSVADKIAVFYAGRVIEQSECAADIFRSPRHPYTRALLDALPAHANSSDGGRLRPMPGAPPVIGDEVPGCAFHSRCEFAQDCCRDAIPDLQVGAAGHELACFVDPWRAQP